MSSPIDSGYESATAEPNSSSAHKYLTPMDDTDLDSKLLAASQLDDGSATMEFRIKDASKAFFGQINNHSQAAKEKMRCFRVAKLVA
jgi:hypothetical protein